MASALQLNRVPLDKWTTREQLCLASAVSCSGDQNWMSVSRTLKLVCGNDTPTRPADWFSQKNCALQYGHMLENVETPKRKKRTSEGGASGNASPATVETPTDLILRRLNDERIQELKADIRREQEEFAQIYRELKALQAGNLSEEQMREMWCNIEQQQEQERVEEMKLENQMREREQQRMEMQRNWRTFTPTNNTTNVSTSIAATASAPADTTTVDMDVEEIIPMQSAQNISNVASNQAQQQQLQPATSPLLSSLLKTPTPADNSTQPMMTTTTNPLSNTTNMQSARSTAPTITTLLTSGYVPNKNQPAITLKAGIPPQKAAQLLSSPISGPPSMSTVPMATITPQNFLSPSQAAPTLSMLLEKNKAAGAVAAAHEDNCNDTMITPKSVEPAIQGQFGNIPTDGTNQGIPIELDEDTPAPHAVNNDANVDIFNEHDSDDPDPNEEQQLLEVFKNIGNIDELDIDVSAVIDDEEVDFLKDMGADSPSEDTNIRGFDRDSADVTKMLSDDTDDIVRGGVDKESTALDNVKHVLIETEPPPQTLEGNVSGDTALAENKPRKVETISSDDSNDNLPLSAVASLEQKASTQDKEIFQENCNDTALDNNDALADSLENPSSIQLSNDKSRIPSFDDDDDDVDKEHDKLEKQLADIVGANDTDESKNLEDEGKSPGASESSDVIVIPTDDDDSSGDKAAKLGNQKSNVDLEAAKIKKDLEADIGGLEISKEDEAELAEESTEMCDTTNQHDTTSSLQPPTISIADTDDDSSTTDISLATRKDDKNSAAAAMSSSIKYSTPQVRKGLHETNRQHQHHETQNKTDDESTTQFSSSSSSSIVGVTPVRPPLLRKLRDRDRSESPLIESDVHNTTGTDNQQRLRRRYSSTPNNNDMSVPNSPASSDRDRDDSETRQSKKLLLSIFHALQYSKNASTLQRAFHDDDDVRFNEICLRPTDMHTIRKQIETGTIRNVTELQRDIMLMCQNGLMLFKQNTNSFKAANAFMQECQAIREFVTNTTFSNSSSSSEHQQTQSTVTTHHVRDINKDMSKSLNVSGISSTKSRSASRKSQRIS